MKILKKLILGTCLISATMYANAATTTIEGNVTADNDFIVVHSQGSVNNVVHRGAYGVQWKKIEAFKFNVNNSASAIESCSVSVIAWGDGSRDQGFAGIFKGDHAVYTGSGVFRAHQSNITSSGWAQNGGPSAAQISTLVNAQKNLPYTMNNGNVASGTAPWIALNFPLANMVNTNLFRWIWSTSNKSKPTYSIFTAPCDKLVKPVSVAVHMPGEHFQCYNVEKADRLPEETIMIADQFGKTTAVLGKPVLLCNPSTKIHNKQEFKMLNPKRHLVCYNYVKQNKVKSQNLFINNQFAPDNIVSGQRELFCVPSSKKHAIPTRPRPVGGVAVSKPVTLNKINNE
ncbi:hypothetical protein V6248_15575 [Pseudoalteromonas agarivorans]|uniref:DUF7450 family protein n=1 Tax=Pseudoalteromonas agarivorans TaxID=176102 RepID=UPI00311E57DC